MSLQMKNNYREMKANKFILRIIACVAACLFFLPVNAQDLQADNMLLFQRDSGGWSKQFKGKAFKYDVNFSATEKIEIAKEAEKDDANIDNMSTTKEIRYLAKAFKTTNNPKYLDAVENGIRYLLKAQYKNGGWPQYYPLNNLYRAQVTFNDNAIINVMKVLQDVALQQNDLEIVNAKLVAPSAKAAEAGISCILKTQIKANGKLTAWCQQYDEVTLKPAKARAYELPSISAAESVSIVQFLLSQPDPTPEMKSAVNAAVEWLDHVKITGYKVVEAPTAGTKKGYDRQLVADSLSTIWARYYEIGSNKPFFCDRDGVVKYNYAELDYERRNGYAWYGNWAKNLLEKTYPAWVKKNLSH
jgi:PelA/Pel-15E family pectate lyase